ncbi:hypothetical protein M595_1023 [Lyngbya aestuarii BL J]|uniref:Uncharacterized protein n=1 Tax=Lyngbya aestuarii BL J TaxID=1348334 RepID=U7QMA0_9CYAN|nr:hypothetical protein M595_1023 [Lyngbya aestuarii BL J]
MSSPVCLSPKKFWVPQMRVLIIDQERKSYHFEKILIFGQLTKLY